MELHGAGIHLFLPTPLRSAVLEPDLGDKNHREVCPGLTWTQSVSSYMFCQFDIVGYCWMIQHGFPNMVKMLKVHLKQHQNVNCI